MGLYRIAIYLRLSKADEGAGAKGGKRGGDGAAESNSIAMQRILLRRYVAEHFMDYEILEFCDDGYTGMDFQRPGVQAMLEIAKNGGIHCIIVKDLSRFARDYVELGAYMEQIFPFLGIRFISVNDRYDSDGYQGGVAGLDVNFKNLLYDLYSRDLSKKVRSSLAIRKEQGKYVSANCPFGYGKSPDDRHALQVEEDEAQVVRQIFALALEGYSCREIAGALNEMQVRTPIEFKMEKGRAHRTPKEGGFSWSSGAVRHILKNEAYTGAIAQKKYDRDSVGGKNRLRPRQEWLVAIDHHLAIIDGEAFGRAQEGMRRGR